MRDSRSTEDPAAPAQPHERAAAPPPLPPPAGAAASSAAVPPVVQGPSGPLRPAAAPLSGSRRARIALLIGDRRRLVGALAVCSLLSGFTESATLVLVAELATTLVGTEHAKTSHTSLFAIHASTGTLLILAFVLTAVRLLFQIPLSILPSRIAADVLANVRSGLFNAFTRASWSVQSADREGQLQETLTGQALQAASGADQTTQLITASLQFLTLITVAVIVNAVAAIVVGITSVALFALLRPMRSRGVRISRDLSGAQVRYAGGVAESNRLAEETQVFGVVAAQRARVGKLIADSQLYFYRAQLITRLITNIYQSLIYVLLVAGLAGLYFIGGHHAGALGAIVLLLLRAGTSGQLLQGAYQGLAQSMPFIERTQELQHRYADSTPSEGHETLSSVDSIAFEHVSFAYTPERPVLDDVTFETFERRSDRHRRAVRSGQVHARADPARPAPPGARALSRQRRRGRGLRARRLAPPGLLRAAGTATAARDRGGEHPLLPRHLRRGRRARRAAGAHPRRRRRLERGLRHDRRAPRRRRLRRPAAAHLPRPRAGRAPDGADPRRAHQRARPAVRDAHQPVAARAQAGASRCSSSRTACRRSRCAIA